MMKNKKMPRTYDLDLTKLDAECALFRWGAITFDTYDIPWELSEQMPVGSGKTDLYDNNQQFVMIGAKEFVTSKRKPDDLMFITMGVSLFHEFKHCKQNRGEDIDKYAATNLVSTFGNDYYYIGNWRQMPYEIAAEYFGVMNMWAALLELCDVETIDKCLLSYINYRADNTSYFLSSVNGGYTDMDQVDAAFQKAYEDSIFGKRDPQPGLSGYPDEFVRLLQADEGVQSPYYEYFDKFIGTVSGEQKDRMLAAMVFHLYPDLKSWQPVLRSEEITFVSEFGKPFPEGTEESRERLGIEDNWDDYESDTILIRNNPCDKLQRGHEFDYLFDSAECDEEDEFVKL